MYCHWYPTRACVAGNGVVRSLWDNVTSSISDGQKTVRWTGDCKHQGGWELGLRGRVNVSESLINVVKRQQAKDADRLEPKGTWSGTDVFCSSVTVAEPPANRRDLTHAGMRAERGKPVAFPQGKQAAK